MPVATLRGIYVGGRWLSGGSATVRTDRWTGEVIDEIATGGAGDAAAAVDAAVEALSRGLSVPERSRILSTTADLLDARAEEFARVVQQDMGKPISSARLEVERAVGTLRYSAEEARRLPGERVPLEATDAGAGTIAVTIPEPLGVVAAITPFNFPVNLVAHKLGPALAAGCPVVLKPSDKAPLAALLLTELFEQAGLPAGWLNVVNGPAEPIVDEWLSDRRVAAIDFTGSARIGWQLKARSPRKSHILELGSNTAMYVDAGSDIARAAADTIAAGFANSGQACISLQRLYVHSAIADEFLSLVAELMKGVRAGDPSLDSTVVGPLVTDEAADRVSSWVEDAVDAGASMLHGGRRSGALIAPTLLATVSATSPLISDEVFGPVVTAITVPDLHEAIQQVNRSDFGLNASIYSSDLKASMEFGRRVEAGTVLVNMPPSFRADHMPYGGVKDSGQGREGVCYAVSELLHQKLFVLKS